jgi:hypothetical protein
MKRRRLARVNCCIGDHFYGASGSGRARRPWQQWGQAPGLPLRQTPGLLAGSIAEDRYEAVVGSTAVGAEVGSTGAAAAEVGSIAGR